jgi:hypothetical protein
MVNTMTTWKFYRNGKTEEVELERWRWEAHYTDGTILQQFDDKGIYHQFKEIEQDRLKLFGMVHDTLPPQIILWRDGLKLIHFYKNYVLLAGTPEEIRLRFYCFGYEYKGEKVINVILPNEGVILVDDVEKITADGVA